MLTASFPGVEYGQLHFRILEKRKTEALKHSRGNYDGEVTISRDMKSELSWWVNNLDCAKCPISRVNPELIMFSDASERGWGCSCGNQTTGGRWTESESQDHINVLEMRAALFALKSFCSGVRNTHVKINIDNTTAIAYINHMGGTKSPECNKVAHEIWDWCIERNIWLSSVHIPGVENVEADHESRVFHDQTEWMLNGKVFSRITKMWGNMDMDLFASRLNKQISPYASWRPDPGAICIDAFTFDWNNINFYAFPPFSLVGRCIQKIQLDCAEGVMIVPLWPTQPWYSPLLQMLIDTPRTLPRRADLLQLPYADELHPLRHKLTLVACRLSGDPCKADRFRQGLPTSSWRPGERALKNNTNTILTNGYISVVKGRLIHFKPM